MQHRGRECQGSATNIKYENSQVQLCVQHSGVLLDGHEAGRHSRYVFAISTESQVTLSYARTRHLEQHGAYESHLL